MAIYWGLGIAISAVTALAILIKSGRTTNEAPPGKNEPAFKLWLWVNEWLDGDASKVNSRRCPLPVLQFLTCRLSGESRQYDCPGFRFGGEFHGEKGLKSEVGRMDGFARLPLEKGAATFTQSRSSLQGIFIPAWPSYQHSFQGKEGRIPMLGNQKLPFS